MTTRSGLHSRTTPHNSPLRASYGVSFLSYKKKSDRDVSRAHCNGHSYTLKQTLHLQFGLDEVLVMFYTPILYGAGSKFHILAP